MFNVTLIFLVKYWNGFEKVTLKFSKLSTNWYLKSVEIVYLGIYYIRVLEST